MNKNNWKEQFDKEFPTCNCRNNLPPHFDDKLTNPSWIKNYISQLLSDARREERRKVELEMIVSDIPTDYTGTARNQQEYSENMKKFILDEIEKHKIAIKRLQALTTAEESIRNLK